MATKNVSRPRIDLDTLLNGNPAWVEVVDFFRAGEFHEEHYLVDAIEKHLLTDGHRRWMYAEKITVPDMLNGRVEGYEGDIREIYNDWNMKLGFRHFGA